MIAKEIFESMGAQVIARHDEPNGTNINRECGSTHIEVLQALVYDTVRISDSLMMVMQTVVLPLMMMAR